MEGLGKSLKAEREKRNISLDQISSQTNISINALTALENEQYDKIPGNIYFKNYIKSYLKSLQINEKDFLKDFSSHADFIHLAKNEISPSCYPKLRYSHFSGRRIFLISLGILLIILLLAFIFFKKKEYFQNLIGFSKPKTDFSQTFVNNSAFTQPIALDFSPLNIQIAFKNACWLQVFKSNRKVIENTYQSGNSLAIFGYDVTLMIGNSEAVDITVNGQRLSQIENTKGATKLALNPYMFRKIKGHS
jgi:cytoskeletal protein RodZ